MKNDHGQLYGMAFYLNVLHIFLPWFTVDSDFTLDHALHLYCHLLSLCGSSTAARLLLYLIVKWLVLKSAFINIYWDCGSLHELARYHLQLVPLVPPALSAPKCSNVLALKEYGFAVVKPPGGNTIPSLFHSLHQTSAFTGNSGCCFSSVP